MKTGLMQCKDAILNTVGPNAKPFERDIVKKIAKEKESKKMKKPKKLLPKTILNVLNDAVCECTL